MKKFKFAFLMVFFGMVAGCSSDSATPSTTISSYGELTYTNGSTTLGSGHYASGTANAFLDCSSAMAIKWLPEKMKKWTLAFGIVTMSRCGFCTPQFTCKPGETVTISSSYNSSGADANPVAFDANSSVFSAGSRIVTCPASGIFTEDASAGGLYSLKISFSADSGSDSEYLKCQ